MANADQEPSFSGDGAIRGGETLVTPWFSIPPHSRRTRLSIFVDHMPLATRCVAQLEGTLDRECAVGLGGAIAMTLEGTRHESVARIDPEACRLVRLRLESIGDEDGHTYFSLRLAFLP